MHDKIEVSTSTLHHLHYTLLSSTHHSLNQHLPPSDANNQVLDILSLTINSVFDDACTSLLVDGQLVTSSIISTEIKDVVTPVNKHYKLSLQSIQNDIQLQTGQLTLMRKNLPQDLKNIYSQLVSFTDNEVSEILSQIDNDADFDAEFDAELDAEFNLPHSSLKESSEKTSGSGESYQKVSGSGESYQVSGSFEENYQKGLELLNSLNQSLPTTSGEVSKLAQIVGILEKLD